MPPLTLIALIGGSILAACGQILLAVGARGRADIVAFLNPWIFVGLSFYALGAILWIYGLSKAPLVQVYPFTVMTFAIVYLGSIVFLGERPTVAGVSGTALVLGGLYLLSFK